MSLEAMAAGVDAEASGLDAEPMPGVIEAQQEQEEAQQAGALAAAAMAVNAVAGLVESTWPCLEYPPEVRQQGAEVLAPLAVKYGMEGGWFAVWLDRWKEEIAAGMFFGGVIFSSIKKVREYEAQLQAEKEAQEVPEHGG